MFDRIETVDPQLKSYLRLTQEKGLAQAAEADQRLAAGESGPLLGVPIAIKDLICVEGVETTAGSKISGRV